jgi:hypothetical protein
LFLCAASSKEFTVINHLYVILALSQYVPTFWVKDPEMVSIALMSDVGAKLGSMNAAGGDRMWTKARLGQSVLLVEVVGYIQRARHNLAKDDQTNVSTFLSYHGEQNIQEVC